MYKNLRRSLAVTLAAGWAAAPLLVRAQGASAAPPQPGDAPLLVGFVHVSPVGDTGWTYQHDQGRIEMERRLGPLVRTRTVENVPEGPDAERVLRDLASQGCGLIFATSFGYLEPALKAARDFPRTVFMHAGGYKSAPNLGTYIGRYYEARYLAGMAAGLASRTGTAGYVAGFPVPEVIQGINAFLLGMRAVRSGAQLKVVWLDTWFDPAREREAALTLVRQGADVLTHHSGSSAVAAAAQAERVQVLPYPSDMHAVAPTAQLSAIVHRWGDFYARTAQAVREGRWTNQPVWGGMRDGFMDLLPLARADWGRRIGKAQAELMAGRLHPFSGRLLDAKGRVRQAAGRMADADIQAMDWFVEGVQAPGRG